MQEQTNKLAVARNLASDLLDEIETKEINISQTLMKVKRLARLLRDQDAQQWLEFEMSGYPKGFSFTRLGTCQKYALPREKIHLEDNHHLESLPALEARVTSTEQIVKSTSLPSISKPVDNHTGASATERVMEAALVAITKQQQSYVVFCSTFQALKSGIHSYVTETFISLELGDVAESVFEGARATVDAFVRFYCPRAAEQLIAMNDRMRDGDAESRSAALTACRRLLATVADALFPARDEPYIDSKGKSRKVGADSYKNRLMAYIDERIKSSSTVSIVNSQIEHLATRLDAVYDKACKGVHDDVDIHEARLTLIQTWLFLAELARLAQHTKTN